MVIRQTDWKNSTETVDAWVNSLFDKNKYKRYENTYFIIGGSLGRLFGIVAEQTGNIRCVSNDGFHKLPSGFFSICV